MGKKKTTTNQTATVAPNAAYTPYINHAADQQRSAFDAAQSNLKTIMPRVDSALDYYGDTLAGNRLSGNPHLQSVIDKTNADITTGVDSRFSTAGRYGSGMHSGVLAKALADNENALRYQDYSTERGYQDAAARGVLSGSTVASALPQMASSTYADAIRSLLGQYTSGTQTGTATESGGLLGQLLSAIGQGAAAGAAASDRRLKRNIIKLGEFADGLGIYVWRYIWGSPAIGVMADEVAELRPWAIGPEYHGFRTVNYGAL